MPSSPKRLRPRHSDRSSHGSNSLMKKGEFPQALRLGVRAVGCESVSSQHTSDANAWRRALCGGPIFPGTGLPEGGRGRLPVVRQQFLDSACGLRGAQPAAPAHP